MRFILGFAVSACLLLASGDLSGRRAPGFSLPDMHQQQHDPQDYRGKPIVLDIIQTRCPHCARFSEVLEKAHRKYGSKLVILSIVIPPDSQNTVGQFAAEHKITTPILFDCGQVSASYLKVTPRNPTINLPHVFLIDANGMIRNDFGYEFNTHNIFEGDALYAEIDRLLGGSGKKK